MRADGRPGSYGLQGILMKRVYELVSLVEPKTVEELSQLHIVPADPTVVVLTNKQIGAASEFKPDVTMGKVLYKGVRLLTSCLSSADCLSSWWPQCASQRYKASAWI